MNPTALKLAREIKALCFIDQDNGRGDEVRTWATLDEDVVAELIDSALAQARLEGARAMKTSMRKHLDKQASFFAQMNEVESLKIAINVNSIKLELDTLDLQQVINESVK
jgi:hypothetical protein